jgi:hypothetical protein
LLSCMTPSSDAVLSSSPSSSLPSFSLYGWSLWQVSANEICFLVWDEESFVCQDCELLIISLFHMLTLLGLGYRYVGNRVYSIVRFCDSVLNM